MSPNTPMEPVRVVASENITLLPLEIQYPPEAAYSPYDATTGLSFCRRSSSLFIFSEARTLPPGELTRSTTALIVESALTLAMTEANLSPATAVFALPSTISPSA